MALLTGVATEAFAQGSISGRVTGPGSVPLPHPVIVQFYDFNGTGGGPSSTTTDASGNYSINLPASTYGVVTNNIDGYINKVYDNIPCSAVCDLSAITPIVVTNSAVTGIDFVLTPGGGRIAGKVTRADGITPIAGVRLFFGGGDADLPFTTALTDASGNYISDGGSVTGSVFAITFNTPLFQDEVYPNIHCFGCDLEDVLPGGPNIAVTMGATTSGIDFALDAGGSISGTVTNSSGQPLANITVNITDSLGNQVAGDIETDAAGNYTTGGFPAGNYFAATEHAPGLVDELWDNIPCPNGFCDQLAGTPIPVVVGATASGRNFVLSPGGTISGTVTNAVGGAPIQAFVGLFTVSGGQTVYVGGSWSNPDNGGYSVVAPAGTYFEAVINNDQGFANQIYNGLPCPNNSCNPAIGAPLNVSTGATISNVNFALAAAGSISGTVTVGGVATSNLQVQVLSASGTILGFQNTNASGVYTFSGLAVGSYYVRTNNTSGVINQVYNGVVCVQCNVTTSGGTLVPVTANATTPINFALSAGGRISGTVTGPGGPISGMSIQFFTATGVSMSAVTTNASGNYSSLGLPPGSYRVRTAATASQNFLDEVWNDILCVPCNVQAGTAVAVTGTSTTGSINFALSPGGAVSGTVTNSSAGGTPVSGVPVTLFNVNGVLLKNITTDGAGNYTLSGLPNGNYFVRTNPAPNLGAQLYNGIPYTGLPLIGTPVSVTVGTTQTGVNFPLVSGGSLSGTVKAAGSNAPIAGVQVAVYTPAGRLVKFPLTDSTGAFMVNGLPAGTYYVSTSVPFTPGVGYIDELYDNAPCLGCATVTAAALNNVTLPCIGPCLPPVTTGTPVVVTNGATRSGVDFLLETGGGAIAGAVTDAATGNGLLNVQVQIYNAAGVVVKNVTTALYAGTYIVRGLAPGTYYARTIVSPATPYYIDEAFGDVPCAPCNVTTTTAILVTANTLTSSVDFALSPGGSLSGLVTDAATANPLWPVDVLLYNAAGTLVKTTFTGSAGTFRFDGLPAGNYFARTQVSGASAAYTDELYDNIPCPCAVTSGSPIVVTAGTTRAGVNFGLAVPTLLTQVMPAAGRKGVTLNVSLIGQSTHFVQGTTTVTFGAGIAVNGIAVGDATHATANITIGSTASLGPRAIIVTTGGEVVSMPAGFLVTPTSVTRGDFDGTGNSDIAVFRPSSGLWYVRGVSTTAWGKPTDIPVPGDYDGDGKIDVAIFRPSTGAWIILQSSTMTAAVATWGGGADIPVPADYDGDGKTDIAIFRPSTGAWFILQSSTATAAVVTWGASGDIPVAADFDGDGKTDIAIFRPPTGAWFILQSSTGTGAVVTWGGAGDIPVVADYDGDGKADIAIFRPSAGAWFIRRSATATGSMTIWGGGSDIPVPGDFDGDGRTDIAVFRPSTGTWFIIQSSSGLGMLAFWGGSGDIPVLKRP